MQPPIPKRGFLARQLHRCLVKYAPGSGKTPTLVINQGTSTCEGVALDKGGNIRGEFGVEQHHCV